MLYPEPCPYGTAQEPYVTAWDFAKFQNLDLSLDGIYPQVESIKVGPFIFSNYLQHHFLCQRTPSSSYPGQSDFDLKIKLTKFVRSRYLPAVTHKRQSKTLNLKEKICTWFVLVNLFVLKEILALHISFEPSKTDIEPLQYLSGFKKG
jgi:hypothetical protein